MSQIPLNKNSEEIDLGMVFKSLGNFFKNILKLIFSIILFYKRKWILFVGLMIIGIIGGYIWDQRFSKEVYTQDVILEPNFESTVYLYDFIDNFNQNFGNVDFLKSLGINQEKVKNLKKINIEPIIQHTDLIDYFKKVYSERDTHHVMEELEPRLLENVKYRKFYKFHKLTFLFVGENENNERIAEFVLEKFRSNAYLQKKLSYEIDALSYNIKENKESLNFINKYLDRLNGESSEKEEQVVVFASEKDIPTVSSLLRQKDVLLEKIDELEEEFVLKKSLFSVLDFGELLNKTRSGLRKKIVLLPFLLIGVASLVFFLNHSYKKGISYLD